MTSLWPAAFSIAVLYQKDLFAGISGCMFLKPFPTILVHPGISRCILNARSTEIARGANGSLSNENPLWKLV